MKGKGLILVLTRLPRPSILSSERLTYGILPDLCHTEKLANSRLDLPWDGQRFVSS